jgi:hypothetical protein
MNPKGSYIKTPFINSGVLARERKRSINVIACLSEYDIRVVVMLSLNYSWFDRWGLCLPFPLELINH